MKRNYRLMVMLLLIGISAIASAEETKTKLWRLQRALHLPDWIALSVEQRTRYETLDNQFRARGQGGDQVIAFRTLIAAEARFQDFHIGGEFIDSRLLLDDRGTPLDNTQVDEADLLQGYLGWNPKNLFGTGLGAEIKAGRETIDLGGRRLVARNAFRNTINSFTGIDIIVKDQDRWQIRGFFNLPVIRLPDQEDGLRAADVRFDHEDLGTYFWGLFGKVSQIPWVGNIEAYFLNLHEDDSSTTNTRNRRLFTPGMRFYKDPAKKQFDYEIETVGQFGKSRATTSRSDVSDLDHLAHYQHAQIGYTFDLPWTPRFLAQYDYASGDGDPNDRDNGRFDTLFGARRWEYGPTGIWGAFARANINSPGYRVIVRPHNNVSAFIGHRLWWLAESRDAWTAANIQDFTGRSGDFIGHQIEASVTWQAIPDNLMLETGWAHLIKGEFARKAPTAPTETADTDYFYVQSTIKF
jgi:hypothetical protein